LTGGEGGGFMRMIMKVRIPAEEGSKSIKDGAMAKLIQQTVELVRPEATFFYPEAGQRTALVVFDMKDSSQLPQIAEPFYWQLNAKVEFSPVMNLEDLQKGLAVIVKK
jgi:hypothetical protein